MYGFAVEAVAAMKRDANVPMRTLGSLTLCRSLLAAGLVDRFRVVVFPVITGVTGRQRIYDGYRVSPVGPLRRRNALAAASVVRARSASASSATSRASFPVRSSSRSRS